jgi:molecular chaperone DnaK
MSDDFEAELDLRRPQPSPAPRKGQIPVATPRLPPVATSAPSAKASPAQRTVSPTTRPSRRPEGSSTARRASPLLIDVTPISLGVETVGGFCDVLIAANTPVPCDRTRIFLTASDGQTTVKVKVAQGEAKHFAENTLLGELELTGLSGAARGEVRVAVTFEIDVDGILNVRAKEDGTGKETRARLHMVGATGDAREMQTMLARQRRQELA